MIPGKTSALLAVLCALSVLADDDLEDLKIRFIQDTDTDRRPALTAFPKYPSIARRDRIEGQATVCFMIDERGKISRASVKEYTDRIFRRPVLRAIKKSSFEPIEPGQVLARGKTCRIYRFRLEPVVADENGDADASP